MDGNTIVVVSVNGFLIIFFIYALLYVFRITPSKTIVSQRPEIREVVKPPIPEVSEVMEPPIPEVTEAIEPPRPEISEVTEVVEASPEVSEVMEPPIPEVTEAIESQKPSQNIINVEGIGLIYAETLKKIGIETTNDLLLAGTTPQDREELAKKTGVSPNLILEWVNLVDLLRIKGVGEEYSDLLEEAGVDTVVELAKRNPEKLYTKMKQINEEKNLVNKVPFLSDVFSWVEQARALPRKVEY